MARITKKLIDSLIVSPKETLDSLPIDKIAKIIEKADKEYHANAQPLFSDAIYDFIKEYLKDKDATNKVLTKVGAQPKTKKTKLPYWMGSMDKIKADPKSLENFKQKFPGSYVVTDKLDGISALLHIKDDTVALYSRGDGAIGQDITNLLNFVGGIPNINDLFNFSRKYDNELAIRGELLITKKHFESKLKDKGANARNMVSGIVNAKVPDQTILKYVKFVAFSVLHPVQIKQSEQLKLLNSFGFQTVTFTVVKGDKMNVEDLSSILIDRRKKSSYEIDGLVVYHDEPHVQDIGKNPTYAFAFKSMLTMDSAEVMVTDVIWNVSKDGYLIPVVEFDPVKLSGVVVKRATGFNGEYIHSNNIGPGATIVVTRSGDVIPYIVRVLKATQPKMPSHSFKWTSTKKDIVLVAENKEQQMKVIENFFTKLDVPGVKAGTIKKMYMAGLDTLPKILSAQVQDIIAIDGFQEKSAHTIVDNIQQKLKSMSCIELMDASNAFGRGFGAKKLKMIVDKLPGIENNEYLPTVQELMAIDGVSNTTATAFIEGITAYRKFVKSTKITCKSQKRSDRNNTENITAKKLLFDEQQIVFTGFRNKSLQDYIEINGGKVTNTISKKVTILVTKDDNSISTKIDSARKLGIQVLSLGNFLRTYNIDIA